MPRFLLIVNYAPEGARALMSSGGSARKSVVEKTASSLGGRLESFDFAFGNDDAYTVVDLPDSESAAALALTVSSSGSVRVRTVVLLTPEQIDRASQIHPEYVPPGQTR
jgi:uncharacterized protein with GYD domain